MEQDGLLAPTHHVATYLPCVYMDVLMSAVCFLARLTHVHTNLGANKSTILISIAHSIIYDFIFTYFRYGTIHTLRNVSHPKPANPMGTRIKWGGSGTEKYPRTGLQSGGKQNPPGLAEAGMGVSNPYPLTRRPGMTGGPRLSLST